MTGAELMQIIASSEFKQDLCELSSYLASIAPETPILHLLAKHLWKGHYKFQLEAKRQDLVVYDETNQTRIESKGTWDFCMEWLERELDKYGDTPLREKWEEAHQLKKGIRWCLALMTYEDIYVKAPSIFVLIICSRNLSTLQSDNHKRICMYKEQLAFDKRRIEKGRSALSYLDATDRLFEKLRRDGERPFSVLKEAITTHGDFDSIYHFRVCEASQ